ncbi:muconolactone Delta-isomerase [Pseudomonas kairouanensis]|uniref:Muconolactone Delta-isomerase n=1 Tax=Pseudomonas kairouanensis TaxID=2293832 RepID=A0A4Z0AI97_9PSED|nr:muconolactone Delta-isomerase [Pseudomonas kairouanensis]TFY85984.1 muconolactone Delta-isomerase [Pseudomonas kairouanensis]
MLFLVQMHVNIPSTFDPQEAAKLIAEEKAFSQELQRDGRWRHLWRVVGQYANFSVFDVASNDELHQLLSALPLYPFMTIQVTPLAQHPSAISAN